MIGYMEKRIGIGGAKKTYRRRRNEKRQAQKHTRGTGRDKLGGGRENCTGEKEIKKE
jgi:hypothetical protein